jgi:2-oxoglutarate ferredoxin oxidoreductase subunit alpha
MDKDARVNVDVDAPVGSSKNTPETVKVSEHIIEIVSDSGEGAQTCGQIFSKVSARMGNGLWTVEIIPAEIEPPARSPAGASGNRIRIGTNAVTNAGDQADLVIAFNEQVLYGRIDAGAFRPGTVVFLENCWSDDLQENIQRSYAEAVEYFRQLELEVCETPMQQECLKLTDDPRRGKNMWALGLLCALYQRDMEIARDEITKRFAKKGEEVLARNLALVNAGYQWGLDNTELRFEISAGPKREPQAVMNGNQAVGLGIMASGMELCAMYPITPATSVSHFLAAEFPKVGGFVHQSEDEIAAVGFALGASFAGKTAVTITSGPGLALKTEFLGLAVIAEIPLVVVDVQRGGPSTGLPTKIEQGDLLATLFASPGDAPKIIIAPATVEECFHFMITARTLAEQFRGPVFVLSDANLATGQQVFPFPHPREEWLSSPIQQSPWQSDVAPYEWDPETGISGRPIPGQKGGEYVVTGLAHDRESHVAYESTINQHSMQMRSRKLAVLQKSLRPPQVHGDSDGDLLVVGWGSTLGSIEEAVDRVRRKGGKVSALHLRFLSPMEPGIEEIFRRFRKVMTIEINYSDDLGEPFIDGESRRYSQLALLLRSRTLVDIDCWSRVPGSPLQPGQIESVIQERLGI